MKKNLVIGLILTLSVSFKANAGVLEMTQSFYADVIEWAIHATKPLKPEW